MRDFSDWTPLHEASNYGFAEIAEFLIEKGEAQRKGQTGFGVKHPPLWVRSEQYELFL